MHPMLGCQSGSWSAALGNMGVIIPLTLRSSWNLYYAGANYSGPTPAACPSGWTQVDYKVTGDANRNLTRTCIPLSGTRSTLYLSGSWQVYYAGANYNGAIPAACPSGWTEVDYKQITSADGDDLVRSCIK